MIYLYWYFKKYAEAVFDDSNFYNINAQKGACSVMYTLAVLFCQVT